MKKLYFTLVSLLLSFAVFAQAPSARSLVVQNQTNCTQYYQVFGDEICKCGSQFVSNLFAIPPGGTHTYPTSVTLGGTFPTIPKGIVGAKIPDGPAGCPISGGTVGHQACNLPPVYSYLSISASCTPCGPTRATWFPAVNCEQVARLIFTP
ncbi:MAG: hypothetical protein EOP54_00615 [Sphingobacteriales bacterium]|nr:MAG: hypothetical protein EOP54_00615 [Sphingobacteriales bacterium]